MATETENKKTVKNFVRLEGYLKDNNLEEIVTQKGTLAISGQLIIALNAIEEYRIRMFAAEKFASGTINPTYEALKNMLPSQTTTIKTLLEANDGATFEQVAPQATKLWATGTFSVYDRKDEAGAVHTSVTLQGAKAGIKDESKPLTKPLAPIAMFDCEGYLNKISDEMEGETETGRLKLEILIPDYYRETAMPIEFIVPADIKDAVLANWNRQDTVSFKGVLVNTRKEVAPQRAARVSLLGHKEELAPTFVFVNERVIQEPYPAYVPEDVKYMKPTEMAELMSNRAKMLEELEITSDKGDNRTPLASSNSVTAPAAKAADYKGFTL